MAYDQIEPFGETRIDHRCKVALAWLLSAFSESVIQPESIRGLSPEVSDVDLDDEPLVSSVCVSPEDVLRDQQEQNSFR